MHSYNYGQVWRKTFLYLYLHARRVCGKIFSYDTLKYGSRRTITLSASLIVSPTAHCLFWDISSFLKSLEHICLAIAAIIIASFKLYIKYYFKFLSSLNAPGIASMMSDAMSEC